MRSRPPRSTRNGTIFPLTTRFRAFEHTERKHADPHRDEEAKRLLVELHEEIDRQYVEQPANVGARRVDLPLEALSGLRRVHLAHLETIPLGEKRQEAVLVAIEDDLLQDMSPEHTDGAAEVMERAVYE